MVVAENSNIIPSIDVVKKANNDIKISAVEHYQSFSSFIPFLKEFAKLNPGFKFKIEKHKTDNNFERIAILFSYSVEALKHCYKVVGVDCAFLDAIGIEGRQKTQLQKFVEGISDDMRLMFKRCFISGVSGKTLNNDMILFAIAISYGELSDDYSFLFGFLTDNEFNLNNRRDFTILSDRGAAILAALRAHYRKAFKKPCPKHIDGNLKKLNFSTTLINLYWKASNAKTKVDCENILNNKIANLSRGKELIKYLNNIHNWQLYKAIERGNRLYELKSSNIIEIIFSWLKECRSYGTPYFVVKSLIYHNMIRIKDIAEKALTCDNPLTLTDRAYLIKQKNDIKVNGIAYKVIEDAVDKDTKAVVHLMSDNINREVFYNVDLKEKTCSCLHYQESGVPCYHAIAFIRSLKIPLNKDHFYDFCFAYNLVEMFSYSDIYSTKFPSENDIFTSVEDYDNQFTMIPLLAEVPDDDTSLLSSKRFASQGEKKHTGVFKKTPRIICKVCSKNISFRSTHPPSACSNHYFKVYGIELITTDFEGIVKIPKVKKSKLEK